MKVIFCSSDKVTSKLIKLSTWGRWSHTAIILEDGVSVVEAVWPNVRMSTLDEVKAAHKQWAVVDIPCTDTVAANKAAISQIGKPYDLWGVLGLWLHREWNDVSEWWCSELVAWAAQQGGTQIFRESTLHRITPQHLWMLPYPILEGN